MKKTIGDNSVHYQIEWSEHFEYERITAGRILPDMPGILSLSEKKGNEFYTLLCLACWREGLRSSLKNYMDELLTKYPNTAAELRERGFHYKYTVIDTTPSDMQDVLYWLIRTYEPVYNNCTGYQDSNRYLDISVQERKIQKS